MKPLDKECSKAGEIFWIMRNLIINFCKLPITVLKSLQVKYPNGYEDDSFKFQSGQQLICKAIRISVEGVNYLIKLDHARKDGLPAGRRLVITAAHPCPAAMDRVTAHGRRHL